VRNKQPGVAIEEWIPGYNKKGYDGTGAVSGYTQDFVSVVI
jgi:hypothetical protein